MKPENYIKIYEALREEINRLCRLDCTIADMEKVKDKGKALKTNTEHKKLCFALTKEHFRGMCDLANLTGEFVYPDGRSTIDSEFGWIFEQY